MKKAFHIIQTDWGIGDVICTLYAVQGLANTYPNSDIHLYLRQHFQWAALADICNLKIYKYSENMSIENAIILYNSNEDPEKVLKHNNSPKKLYSSYLGVSPFTPKLSEKISRSERKFSEKYVVLSPFASQKNRTWNLENWIFLSHELAKQGLKVIALDSPFQNERSVPIGAELYWGQSAEWIASVCFHAELIIGNDSGIAHLGGWLGTKTITIMSQLLPNQFYDMTMNKFCTPTKYDCVGCRFMPSKGYTKGCDIECYALQSIDSKNVLDFVIKYLNQ